MEGAVEFSLTFSIPEGIYSRLSDLYQEFMLSGFRFKGVSEEDFIKIALCHCLNLGIRFLCF